MEGRGDAVRLTELTQKLTAPLNINIQTQLAGPGRAVCLRVCVWAHTVHVQEQRRARWQAESEETHIHVVCVDETHTHAAVYAVFNSFTTHTHT